MAFGAPRTRYRRLATPYRVGFPPTIHPAPNRRTPLALIIAREAGARKQLAVAIKPVKFSEAALCGAFEEVMRSIKLCFCITVKFGFFASLLIEKIPQKFPSLGKLHGIVYRLFILGAHIGAIVMII